MHMLHYLSTLLIAWRDLLHRALYGRFTNQYCQKLHVVILIWTATQLTGARSQ